MSTTAGTPPRRRFVLATDVPPLVRAASLSMGLVKHCKTDTWGHLVELLWLCGGHEPPTNKAESVLLALDEVEVSADDWALMRRFDPVLRQLSLTPLVTVAVCADCGRWGLVSGAAPSKCKLTLRCLGRPVRAKVATKEPLKKQADSPADASEHPTPPNEQGEAALVEPV